MVEISDNDNAIGTQASSRNEGMGAGGSGVSGSGGSSSSVGSSSGSSSGSSGGGGSERVATSGVVIQCEQCGSNEYQLLDAKTGEVMCAYCRSRWIVPALIHKTETEKYLEQMAKRPKVTYDNTTETDKKLMDIAAGLIGAINPIRTIGSTIKRILTVVGIVVLVIVVLVIVLFVVNIF